METLDYFQLGRFYLLPKIHKRLHNVPGIPVISNSSFFKEDFRHSQIFIKSFVKDTNDFLKKLPNLPDLPSDIILCTIDVVGLYANIPHKDGLDALCRTFNNRNDKSVYTESLLDLANCVLENNVFEHNGERKKNYHSFS